MGRMRREKYSRGGFCGKRENERTQPKIINTLPPLNIDIPARFSKIEVKKGERAEFFFFSFSDGTGYICINIYQGLWQLKQKKIIYLHRQMQFLFSFLSGYANLFVSNLTTTVLKWFISGKKRDTIPMAR